MATFYLDFEAGSDAADGTSFANRWLTITSGATAARTAPGDTIRIMASPDETLVGNADWTNASKTVTLAAAVTQSITDCETAWTASANVTATANTSNFKENLKSASLAIAAGFTTGKAAYFATGALDLSAYQQVTFWINNSAALAASTLSLRLCSDTIGDTTVDTIAIPAIASAGVWAAITVDTGGALGSAIASIALYADLDPGATTILLDNITACKASSAADSLTLNSLIGKVHNRVWEASTTYAANAIRKPTQPNRNGLRYKVTAGGGGASGSSEPTWPNAIGMTVTDGALTWTAEGIEDTWYALQSISGATLLIDNAVATLATAGRGYYGETETVATYKREPIQPTMLVSANTVASSLNESGTANSLIVYSGGWNRTDMSTQTGETWVTGRNGRGEAISGNSVTGLTGVELKNLHYVRFNQGFTPGTTSTGGVLKLTNYSFNHCSSNAIQSDDTTYTMVMDGGSLNNNGSGNIYGLLLANTTRYVISRLRAENNIGRGMGNGANDAGVNGRMQDVLARNNSVYGIDALGPLHFDVYGLVTGGNATAGVNDPYGRMKLYNCSIPESTEFVAPTAGIDGYRSSGKHDQTADNHLITTDGGTIVSATDQRNTASGISWKFRPTATTRGLLYPLRMKVAKLACAASVAVTVKVYTRRDATDIKGKLVVLGGQLAGVPETSVACEPTINTWVESGALTFTPTEAGVIEVEYHCWDGVGTTNNLWIDDLTVT